jgi:fructokinase
MAAAGRVLIGAVEGGGTKFVCAVAEPALAVVDRAVIPTRDPSTTFSDIIDFFDTAARRHGEIASMGIACFGPLQLQIGAPDYGHLLRTPKDGWSGVDVIAPFKARFPVPIALDTDVGAAARGELDLGAGRGDGSLAYVTVGTGIGGAVAPRPAGAHLMHAEMGHLMVRRDPRDAGFTGLCPFHGDCLEGLASGPAIRARWGCDLSGLPSAHPGHAIIAGYLAQLVVAIALLHSPRSVVLGGGVMKDGALLPLVREATSSLLHGYLPPLRDPADVERFVRAPAFAGDSAIAGAVLMALDSLEASMKRRT